MLGTNLASGSWLLASGFFATPMEIKKGIGVSPGVVISTAVVLDAEDLVIPKRTIEPEQVPVESERLGHAIADAVVELTQLRDEITAKHGREIGGIFDFHLGILKDKTILKQLLDEIRNQLTTAEYAVSTVMRRYANKFLAMPLLPPKPCKVPLSSPTRSMRFSWRDAKV